jgi:cell division protein FtsI (penicillin-binding protein 3)
MTPLRTEKERARAAESNEFHLRRQEKMRLRHARQTKQRYSFIGFLFLLIMGYLGWTLFRWQVLKATELRAQALQQQTKRVQSYLPRLALTDRKGVALANDEPIYALYAHPYILKNEAELQFSQALKKKKTTPDQKSSAFPNYVNRAAEALAPILKTSKEKLVAQLQDTSKKTISLTRDLSQGEMEQVSALKIAGLEKEMRRRRVYPSGEESATLVGFIDYNGVGQSGVEQYYNRALAGIDDEQRKLYFNGFGQVLASQTPENFFQTDDRSVVLSLDMRLQRAAHLAIQQGVKEYRAKRGAAIIMDPRNGELLALASSPSFDNNALEKYDPKVFKNWTVTELYEPGSTFKPLNIAMGLDSGRIHANDVVYDGGSLSLSRRTIRNANGRGNGAISVTEVLKRSSNIGMVRLMQKLDHGDYFDRLRALGIGLRSGIDLPGEAAGIFKSKEQFVRYPIESATAAFGQGVSMTPLQLVRFHAALANGGYLMQPHVATKMVNSQGEVIWSPELTAPKRVFSEESARTVRQMMVQIVASGTGTAAKIPGYEIAGKTGTAQKVNPNGKGYIQGKKITSFVAHFPADKPRYVVLVVMDEPGVAGAFGSTTAAPVVRKILEEIISADRLLPKGPIPLPGRLEDDKKKAAKVGAPKD